MSYSQSIAEPKKKFLDLLIDIFFETNYNLYVRKQYYIAIGGFENILSIIGAPNIPELRTVYEKVTGFWAVGQGSSQEIIDVANIIQKYLMDHWFSELQLGIVQTSTIAGDVKPPENKPINPEQSSRI